MLVSVTATQMGWPRQIDGAQTSEHNRNVRRRSPVARPEVADYSVAKERLMAEILISALFSATTRRIHQRVGRDVERCL
jgi:hypothetical protein